MERMWWAEAPSCVLASLFFAVGLAGCEEKAAEAEVEAAATKVEKVEAPAPEPEPSAAEVAKKAAELAEEESAQAEVEANPLTECCRALGQRAFKLRSPEFHGASKVCGEAMGEEKKMADILPEIKKALKAEPLPDECQGE